MNETVAPMIVDHQQWLPEEVDILTELFPCRPDHLATEDSPRPPKTEAPSDLSNRYVFIYFRHPNKACFESMDRQLIASFASSAANRISCTLSFLDYSAVFSGSRQTVKTTSKKRPTTKSQTSHSSCAGKKARHAVAKGNVGESKRGGVGLSTTKQRPLVPIAPMPTIHAPVLPSTALVHRQTAGTAIKQPTMPMAIHAQHQPLSLTAPGVVRPSNILRAVSLEHIVHQNATQRSAKKSNNGMTIPNPLRSNCSSASSSSSSGSLSSSSSKKNPRASSAVSSCPKKERNRYMSKRNRERSKAKFESLMISFQQLQSENALLVRILKDERNKAAQQEAQEEQQGETSSSPSSSPKKNLAAAIETTLQECKALEKIQPVVWEHCTNRGIAREITKVLASSHSQDRTDQHEDRAEAMMED